MNRMQAVDELLERIDSLVGNETPEQLAERLKRREERKAKKTK